MTEPRPVYIAAAAALGPRQDHTAEARSPLVADPPPSALKELVKELTGQHLRQASHFVELAVAGAQLCLKRLSVTAPAATGVYLGTGLAEVQKTRALFQQTMQGAIASPFDFINAANNMAAFYVAKLAGFESRNLTLTREELSFESALALARADVAAGRIPLALVGGVDESAQPRAEHLRRIDLRDDQIMGEGSGWLCLSAGREGALGELVAVEEFASMDWDAVTQFARAHREGQERIVVLPGFRLEPRDVAQLKEHPGGELESEDYLRYCGCYFSAAAFGLAAVFDRPRTESALYLHVNRDAAGRMAVVGLRAFRRPR